MFGPSLIWGFSLKCVHRASSLLGKFCNPHNCQAYTLIRVSVRRETVIHYAATQSRVVIPAVTVYLKKTPTWAHQELPQKTIKNNLQVFKYIDTNYVFQRMRLLIPMRKKYWVAFPLAVVMIYVVLCCSTLGFLCE